MMLLTKALTLVTLATLPLWTVATESQYDYPACARRPEHNPKYFCVIIGQDHTVYKQYNLPRGGPYEPYYVEGWKQPRRINWERNLASMSMYRPDAPDFVYGEKNNMCRIQDVLMLDSVQNNTVVVFSQQCSFPPTSGDNRFTFNSSLVTSGVDDPSIFMYAKPSPRNNNATFPQGATVISLDEYVINGQFDERKATDGTLGVDGKPLGKCPSGFFSGKYRFNTGTETPLVVLYVVYAILLVLLVAWSIVRACAAKQPVVGKGVKHVQEGSTVLDVRLLEERGGPITPATRSSKVHLGKDVEDIIQTGFTHSIFGQLVFIYFILATLGLNTLLVVLILDNTGYFVTSVYSGLFDPFAVIIYVWVPMWFGTSIWLGLTVIYKEKMINFFRYSAPLDIAERVRLFKPETSPVLLADRSGISQWVQRIETILANTFFFGVIQEGYEETVLVQHNTNGTRFVEFQHLRYTYDVECQCFVPYSIVLPSTYNQILAQGVGLSTTESQSRMDVIGQNAIQVEMPTIARSIVNEVFVFFYIYQLVCYYVWYFTDYKWVAALNTVVIVCAASINIYTKRSMLASVIHMTNYQTNVDVYRDQIWNNLDASELVPGDQIRVQENWILPCDVVVVKGSTVCDESMLTGESMPVQKTAVPSDSNAIYSPESTGKKYTLLSGTSTLSSGRQEEILAVVQSTGAHTSRGQLIQSILFPITLRFKYDEHLKAVVGLLFLFAFLAAYLAMAFLIDNAGVANKLFAFVYGMFMFSAVLNPLLPVVITIGQVMAAKRLQEKKVFCLNPHRITLAGKVRLFCFDKTGTITKQGLDYRGVVPVSRGQFSPEVCNITDKQGLLTYAMASCHALGSLNGKLVGNEVEVKMFEATEWTLKEKEGEAPQVIPPSGDKEEGLVVLKRFEFDHHRMSMSVVMQHSITKQIYVFCKGSYEKIQSISESESIPSEYTTVAEGLAKEGCYVLGISYKQVDMMPEEALRVFLSDRDAIESDLSLLGLIMFRNELKTDSKDALLTLKQGNVRCVMITGDNAMTGCYVARASGMVQSDTRVLLGDVTIEGVLVWSDIDTYEIFSTNQIVEMVNTVELAVTGKAFDYLVADQSIHSILFHIRIFSRMTPQGKVDCVQLFMAAGAVTGMCGDGGNDCGALRIAHVGVALSEAEASVVSPFTSQTKTLSSVVDIVMEGRGALATSFASVKYLILYGLIGIGIRFVMYKNSVFISQFGFMYLDGAISTGLAYAITRARPLKALGTQRPTSSLLGPTTLVSILGQTFIHVFFLYGGIQYVMNQDWYCPFDPSGVNLVQWWHLQDSNLGSSLFVLGCFQQTVGGITCSFGSKFRRSVFRNNFLIGYYLILMAFLSVLWLGPPSRLTDQFRMSSSTNVITLPDIPSPLSFRWKLFWIGVVNTIAVIVFEWVVVLGPVRDYFRKKYHKDHLQLKM